VFGLYEELAERHMVAGRTKLWNGPPPTLGLMEPRPRLRSLLLTTASL
jgi:hypothetical protein